MLAGEAERTALRRLIGEKETSDLKSHPLLGELMRNAFTISA